MTITISPQTEALLQEHAGRTGQDADQLADALLAAALQEQTRDFEEAVQGIAEGLADVEAGRVTPLEQVVAEAQERRRRREGARSSSTAEKAA